VVNDFLGALRILCGKSHFSLEFKLQAFKD